MLINQTFRDLRGKLFNFSNQYNQQFSPFSLVLLTYYRRPYAIKTLRSKAPSSPNCSPEVFLPVQVLPVNVFLRRSKPDVPGARLEVTVQTGGWRVGTEAGEDLPVVRVDRLGVRQVGQRHEGNADGVTLELSLLGLDIDRDGSHFLAVEIQGADTGASAALTGGTEKTTGVGRHLQIFTRLPAHSSGQTRANPKFSALTCDNSHRKQSLSVQFPTSH